MVIQVKTNNERIAEWLGLVRLDRPEADVLRWLDRFLEEWRGKDGLFEKIIERELWPAFLAQLLKDMDIFVAAEDDGSEWIETRHIYDLLTVGPSQLTATLLEVIDVGNSI